MACRRCLPKSSTSRRFLSTTRVLADQLGSSGKSYAQGVRNADPENLLEPGNQVSLLFDDLPTRAYRELDLDAERLHYARLVEWQLPELGQKYGQQSLYTPPAAHVIRSTRTEWAFEPEHDQTSTATVEVAWKDIADRLSSDAARHKFLLLLGQRYRLFEGKIIIRGDRFPAYAQNLKWCSDQLDETLREAQIDPKKFADVPLDTRGHRPPKLSIADFPADWLPSSKDQASVARQQRRRQRQRRNSSLRVQQSEELDRVANRPAIDDAPHGGVELQGSVAGLDGRIVAGKTRDLLPTDP